MRNRYALAGVLAASIGAASQSSALTQPVALNHEAELGACTVNIFAIGGTASVEVVKFGVGILANVLIQNEQTRLWANDAAGSISSQCGVSEDSLRLVQPTGLLVDTAPFGLYYTTNGIETFLGIGDSVQLALTAKPTGVAAREFTVTASFGRPVEGFAANDISIINGTAGTINGSGDEYTFVVTPESDGEVTVTVAASAVTSTIGEPNVAATISLTGDFTGPTVELTSDANDPQYGPFTVTATFSEAVTGFAEGDVSVNNGTLSNFQSTSSSIYTFLITPTADGDVAINIAADVAQDTASNGNIAADQLRVTYSSDVPDGLPTEDIRTSVAVGSCSANTRVRYVEIQKAWVANVTLNIPDVGTAYGGGGVYTTSGAKQLSPAVTANHVAACLGGEVTPEDVALVSDGPSGDYATDAVLGFGFKLRTASNGYQVNVFYTFGIGNLNALPEPADFVIPPTVEMTSDAASLQSRPFTVTATFSEAVTGFEEGDVSVNNGTLSNFNEISDEIYTFVITPAADGELTVDIAANAAQNAATTGNKAAPQLTVTADVTGPTVELTSDANDPHSGSFTVTATFSEPVTGFEEGDVSVNNGTLSNFQSTSSSVYTFLITPTADGDVAINIAADMAQDVAGNGNGGTSPLSATTDATAPIVSITGPTGVVTESFTLRKI